MDFFYIRHHYQSIVRSSSFDGEVFAFAIITLVFGSSAALSISLLDDYATTVNSWFNQSNANYQLFLMLYVFTDMVIRLVFRRPLPKLKHYVLWTEKSNEIAKQYLLTSLFGIGPYLLFIPLLIVVWKTGEWMGAVGVLAVFFWWLSNHFLGLVAQFTSKKTKVIIGSIIGVLILFQLLVPTSLLPQIIIHPISALAAMFFTAFWAYIAIKKTIEKREVNDEKSGGGILDSLPVLSFNNPVLQLEWALLIRNKRTRSNLLMGLISVLILPFLMNGDSEWTITTMIFFITTGFFIVQHGVYSLGWEGSYFDFLVTNISPKSFIQTRYLFYIGTCLVGLILATIPTLINGLNWTPLIMVFLYNVGVTIPLVLYRSTFNTTKIILTENSFMNYNGMMTGPIFVTSFLVILLPLFIYGIGEGFLGENTVYLLGGLGGLGIILFKPFTYLIAANYQKRKYQLSQSFKA